MRFDAGWYGGIATHGYDRDVNFERQRNIAFFPAMPLLMRAVAPVFGSSGSGLPPERRMVRTLWAGVAVSLAAFLLALYYFVKLASQLVGPERAAGATLLLAAYPFACFFNAPYTESLFLLASVAAAYHFGRAEWAYAAGWGFLAGLTRPNGFFLSVPLALLALRQLLSVRTAGTGRDWSQSVKALAAAAMPVAGMLAFTTYLYFLIGVWFAWSRSHQAWGRSFTGLEPLRAGYWRLQHEGLVGVALASPFNTLNALRRRLCPADDLAGGAPARRGVGTLHRAHRGTADLRRRRLVARAHDIDTVSDLPGPGGDPSVPQRSRLGRGVRDPAGSLCGDVLHLARIVLTQVNSKRLTPNV